MNRRGFLGSLLGTVALLVADKFPFFARLEEEPWQMPDKYPYKMLFKGNGMTIQAPAIKEIIQSGCKIEFIAHPLLAKQTLYVESAVLLTDKGRVISEQRLEWPATMIVGDTLNVTYNLFGPGTLEEVIERKLYDHSRPR